MSMKWTKLYKYIYPLHYIVTIIPTAKLGKLLKASEKIQTIICFRLWISRYLNPGGRNGRKQSRNSRSTSSRGHFAPVQAAVADHSHQHAATAAAADETNSQSVPDTLTPDFVPKAWSSFRLNKKSLLGAIESTPGWVARGKPRGQ